MRCKACDRPLTLTGDTELCGLCLGVADNVFEPDYQEAIENDISKEDDTEEPDFVSY